MLWVERESEDSLSTLTGAWADVQGEVEVTLLLRTGRPGRNRVTARTDMGPREVCTVPFARASIIGQLWEQSASKHDR